MSEPDGLLFAYVFDGNGGGRSADWQEIADWRPSDGVLWVHLDRTGERAASWLNDDPGIDKATAETLLMPVANRPRVQRIGNALLIILRGINLNPGDAPDDMVGVHMWIEEHRIITLRRRRLMAGTEIAEQIDAGRGPKNVSEFLSDLAERLLQTMVPVIADLDDRVDGLQAALLETTDSSLRRDLQNVRQAAITFRRYLAPQRDALSRLHAEQVPWLRDLDRSYLREIADRTLRFVEDLDSARERAAIAQDELNNRVADQMNRTMYLLTVVAALLLPPSLLTGLFGINVAGMPGIDTGWAFTVVAVAIPIIAVIEFIVLRWLKWI